MRLDGFVQDRTREWCAPTEEKLGEACNLGERSVRNYVHELEAAGYIRIQKRGRRNVYVFLSTNSDQEEANRNDSAGVEMPAAEDTGTKRPDNTGKNIPVRPGELLIPQVPEGDISPRRRDEKAAAVERQQTYEAQSELDDAAAAFLSHFPTLSSAEILSTYGPELTLHAVRQLRAKDKPAKNPAGLLRYILRHPGATVMADAREMLSEYRRDLSQRDRQRRAPREARSRTEIFAWLQDQPDKAELRAKCDKHVRQVAGRQCDERTVQELVVGFYWRERKKRDRQALRQT